MENKYKINKAKVGRDALLLCWLCIISCWLLKILGVNDFNIPQTIITVDNMFIVKNVCYLALYIINGLLFFFNTFKKKIKT